jgi:hypothetical protein
MMIATCAGQGPSAGSASRLIVAADIGGIQT